VDLSAVRRGDTETSIRVAVDAMGGDHAPVEVVHGALQYAKREPRDQLFLVGDPDRIRTAAGGPLPQNVFIEAASQVVEMHEHPAKALREKKDASILVAMGLVKSGRADAVVTAGHTGAGMAAACSSNVSMVSSSSPAR